ncbi:hypothetical protein BpHYR1_025129 [Brachionus plicatilis]|uniref:Uncharacterized protein n=1 Tax=Brachionus plicatilis TaxID=10195 RepID=A0A3M7RRU4_BRAPC|nr:hypothetical protein BpHYR1_025129 [Brachionus plicatilis]
MLGILVDRLVQRYLVYLNVSVYWLEQVGFVRVNVVEQFALVEKHFVLFAFDAVEFDVDGSTV